MAIVAGPAAAQQCNPPYDVSGDGVFNNDDPKFLLVYLFSGGQAPVCDADANGDGQVNIADAIFMIDLLADAACAAAELGNVDGKGFITLVDVNHLLNYLFLNGPPPVPCNDVADANGDGSLSIADAVAITDLLDCPAVPGDSNSDELVNADDATIILEYLFSNGDEPFPCVEAGDFNQDGDTTIIDALGILQQPGVACSAATLGNVDGKGFVTLVDVHYLLNYLFLNGPPPVPCDDVADANGDGNLTIGDAVAITNILDCPAVPGDSNSDEVVNVEDAKIILNYLFLGGDDPFPCVAAGDFNGDGDTDLADAIGILSQ